MDSLAGKPTHPTRAKLLATVAEEVGNALIDLILYRALGPDQGSS